MPGVSIDAQIAEVQRELLMRRQGTPRAGKAARLTPSQEALCNAHLQAVLDTLAAVRDGTLSPRS